MMYSDLGSKCYSQCTLNKWFRSYKYFSRFDIVPRRMRDNLKNTLMSSSTKIVVLWVAPDISLTALQNALESEVLVRHYFGY